MTTLGTLAIMFLAAFEEMAVATIMPRVADDLHGQSLYSLALAAPLATAIVGMVVSGAWTDQRGPVGPFWTGGALFVIGLLTSGLARDMITFTGGRVLQGLGIGAINVTVYVLVARLYPQHLHPKIFGLFAACWVLPSMVGPFLAGVVANVLSWHWVFLGVVVLVGGAAALIAPSLNRLGRAESTSSAPPASRARVASDLSRAVLIAVAVLAIGLVGRATGYGPVALVLLVALVVVLIRRLLPPGAFRLAQGLPATVVLKAFVGAAYFGAEAYLPLLFNKVYGLDLTLSGLALTAAAITWAISSWLQGRYLTVLRDRTLLILAVGIVLACLASLAVLTALHAPIWLLVCAWGVGGFGMGLCYPRMSTMIIRLSPREKQGFNSAALNMADSTGSAVGVAGLGVFQRGAEAGALVLLFAVAATVAALGWGISTRTGRGRDDALTRHEPVFTGAIPLQTLPDPEHTDPSVFGGTKGGTTGGKAAGEAGEAQSPPDDAPHDDAPPDDASRG